jgi:hypothetical protein
MNQNKTFFLSRFTLIILAIALLNSCKKDDSDQNTNQSNQVPEISTVNASNITNTSVTSGGEIISEGSAIITAKGVCWSMSANTSVDDNTTSEGSGDADFTSTISGLSPNTTYYYRAYATNSQGTGYGEELLFTTEKNEVIVPCEPDKNSIRFNFQDISYSSISDSPNDLLYGSHGITGFSQNSDLSIEFSVEPETGFYITSAGSSFIDDDKCVVTGVFGGFSSSRYVAKAYDTVYVTKLGAGKYSMTFCDLEFNSISTSGTFQSDGNLTLE